MLYGCSFSPDPDRKFDMKEVLMIKKGIALFDLHIPEHHAPLLSNVLRYMKDQKFDELVLGGDTMTMASLSRHDLNSGNMRALEGKRVKTDIKHGSDILDALSGTLNRGAAKVYLQGNHEDWVEQFIDKYPALEGILELENLMGLEKKGYKVIKPRHSYKSGKMYFIHGDIFGKYTPVFHSKKVVELYNRNVFYGDRHQHQSYIKASPVDINDKHMAISVPAMCQLNPKWAKDRPNNWCNGFMVWYSNGSKFNAYTVVSVDGSFIAPNGKEYNGNETV